MDDFALLLLVASWLDLQRTKTAQCLFLLRLLCGAGSTLRIWVKKEEVSEGMNLSDEGLFDWIAVLGEAKWSLKEIDNYLLKKSEAHRQLGSRRRRKRSIKRVLRKYKDMCEKNTSSFEVLDSPDFFKDKRKILAAVYRIDFFKT